MCTTEQPRGSWPDGQDDEQIVVICGRQPAYEYRRMAAWRRRKEGLAVIHKRTLRVVHEQDLAVCSRPPRARLRKKWGRVEAAQPNQIWHADTTKIWAGPAAGWRILVSVTDRCTGEIAESESVEPLPDGGSARGDRTNCAYSTTCGKSRGWNDANQPQHYAVQFDGVHREPQLTGNHA